MLVIVGTVLVIIVALVFAFQQIESKQESENEVAQKRNYDEVMDKVRSKLDVLHPAEKEIDALRRKKYMQS